MIDISNDMYLIRAVICEAAGFVSAPHTRMRPQIFPDGNMWCVLYGENLQEGIAGFGETVEKACADFDKNWSGQKLAASRSVTDQSALSSTRGA